MNGLSRALLKALVILALVFSTISLGLATDDTPLSTSTLGTLDELGELATPIKLLLFLSALSFIPATLIAVTAFTRIVIVMSMLRLAFGMQQTPPTSILLSLALFLTIFTMTPVFEKVHQNAIQPVLQSEKTLEQGFDAALLPLRDFMIRQTREKDLVMILDTAKVEMPNRLEDIKTVHLIPAFMLSELRTAFKIGFVLFIPFLLIDLVVASILMSLGMIMVPPMTIALPIKILLFVLIDGWSLVTQSLLASFH